MKNICEKISEGRKKNRILQIIGIRGEEKSPEEVEAILEERRKKWKPYVSKHTQGVLKIFSENAVSPMKGGYMD